MEQMPDLVLSTLNMMVEAEQQYKEIRKQREENEQEELRRMKRIRICCVNDWLNSVLLGSSKLPLCFLDLPACSTSIEMKTG